MFSLDDSIQQSQKREEKKRKNGVGNTFFFFFFFFYSFLLWDYYSITPERYTTHTHTPIACAPTAPMPILFLLRTLPSSGFPTKKDPLSIDTYAPQPWQASPTARMALPPSRLLPPTSGISTASNPNFAKVSWTCVRLYRSALLASISVTTPHDFK